MFCFHTLIGSTSADKPVPGASRRARRGVGTIAYLLSLVVMLGSPLFSVDIRAQDEPGSSAPQTTATESTTTTESTAATETENAEASPAAVQATPAPPRPAIDTHKIRLERLSEEVKEEDLRWLEAEGGKFMALWQGDKTGRPFGAALILHAEGESPDMPYTIHALRNNLPLHGWATLAIEIPDLKPLPIPPRPEPRPATAEGATDAGPTGDAKADTKPAKETSPDQSASSPASQSAKSKDSGVDPEAVSDARIQAAIAYLKSQGQYNITLIAHGISALRATRFISKATPAESITKQGASTKTNRPFRALILVGARNHLAEGDPLIETWFTDPGLPVLDIVFGDHYLDESEASARKQAARAAAFTQYFQYQMLRPTLANAENENELTRRVRGFLQKNARGVEVERKR